MSIFKDQEEQNKKQMSLFDYQLPHATFVSRKSDSHYDRIAIQPLPLESTKAPRFVTLSAIIHAAAIVAIGMMTLPLLVKPDVETITFEIADLPPGPAPLGGEVPDGLPAVTQALPKASAPAPEALVVAPVAPVAAPAVVTKKSTPPASPVKSSSPKAEAIAAVPATIDDIDAPSLDAATESNSALAAQSSELDAVSESLENDLAAVDENHEKELAQEKEKLAAMAKKLENDKLKQIAEAKTAQKNEAARLAKIQEELKEKNAAKEKAASEAAALAALEAETAKAVEQATAEVNEDDSATGDAQAQQASIGGSGASQGNLNQPGIPDGVRSLDQLRQMPNNPRPQYSREERRRGDQGEIAFIAYISKEGYPVQFKLVRSTGFRNLDAKTLAALKKWRFQPGQEGWVELPFRWDLKGGPQEDGGLLRGAVGSR